MEKGRDHIFKNELKIYPRQDNFLITEAAMTPKKNREKMAEVMFEKF